MNLLCTLAVLLAVTQAPVPTSGKATNHGVRDGHTQNQNANTGEKPSVPALASITKDKNGPSLETHSDQHSTDLNQPTINITNPAPVPIPWGWREWTVWGGNLAVAIVGLGGIGVAIATLLKLERQTKATEDQLRIAEKTIVFTQRPRISARNFYFSKMTAIGRQVPNGISEGSEAAGQFYIGNSGGTDAKIREVLCIVHLEGGDNLAGERPYEGMIGSAEDTVLHPGSSIPYFFRMENPLTHDEAYRLAMSMETLKMHVMGKVVYVDELGIVRTTHFCRRYIPARRRFEPVDNPDYENAD
ncbi:hypothetical protein [Granulicella aggregans]|nr:hypothetical protein [Granulicella aggregans]